LKNIICKCLSRTRRRIREGGKVAKISLDFYMKIKQKQGKGSKKVGTNLQIYDGFPSVKLEQVSQGEGFTRIRVDFKHTNQIPTVKVEQVELEKKGKFAKFRFEK
jgi:hypothetical protein